MNMKESILKKRSYAFALRVVRLYKYLCKHKEFVLSKQVLRSGTSIGALVSEAEFGQSRADFISKLSIALKETNETIYWLSLLRDSSYIDEKAFDSIYPDAEELMRLLISSIKTAKQNSKKK